MAASSLSSGFVHLSLEIDDKSKSIELLQQLINNATIRHATEISNLENDQAASLEKVTSECNDIQAKISNTTQSLTERKDAFDSQINELLNVKKEGEAKKKKTLDIVRTAIAENKEKAHKAYKEEQTLREKQWHDNRVSEIQKLTWKGIQPNIDRLTRKHQEQVEEIKAKTEFAKQKLELSADNDLQERVLEYQTNHEANNTCLKQQSDFANNLLREQNEQQASVNKLKERLEHDLESGKKLYALQLETLAKDQSVATSKLKCSQTQHLAQQLLTKKEARKAELESKLDRLSKDIILAPKAQWEESWLAESKIRIEKQNKKEMNDLLRWRKVEIDGIIRKSLVEQDQDTSASAKYDAVAQLTESHSANIEELNNKINKQRSNNEVTKAKLSSIAKKKANIKDKIAKTEDGIIDVEEKLGDITNKYERTQRQHKQRLEDAQDQIENRIKSITRQRNEIEQDIMNSKENNEKALK